MTPINSMSLRRYLANIIFAGIFFFLDQIKFCSYVCLDIGY
jgi:hypothetical protein